MNAGHEARIVERVLDAAVQGLGAEVVAVVEHDRAGLLEREHRPDVVGHRADRALHVLVRLRVPERVRVVEGDLRGDVAAEGVVGRRLVRDHVELLAGLRPGRLDLRGVADERDRFRLAGRGRRRVPSPAPRLGRA